MNIKVLPLSGWMKDYGDYDQGVPLKHDILRRQQERQYIHMKVAHPRLEIPVNEGFLKHEGRYLIGRLCFFVRNGVAYLEGDEGRMFLYDLQILKDKELVKDKVAVETLLKAELKVFGKVRSKAHARGLSYLKGDRQQDLRLLAFRKRLKDKVQKR
ncbi:hypothetical protein NVP1293O_43 [Vibrio phage 1.293.O._10N.261.52.E1]|nr:hypothetical protein NVP1293O_43 [Vibrio phage 1.293.O._10N.261.52.E1]